MFSRIRVALGFALLLILITSITVLAKGGFSFITITSPDLKEAVRVIDPALITDFFAFADFSRDKTEEPANPGAGYEITRYYVDGSRETAFDHLHYYPETGFVYYDGIVNGSSEYDGKWYTAHPGIQAAFENALPGRNSQSAPPVAQSQPITAPDPTQSKPSISGTQPITLIAIVAGLVVILVLAFRVRKPSTG
jgi:hypothetical protein